MSTGPKSKQTFLVRLSRVRLTVVLRKRSVHEHVPRLHQQTRPKWRFFSLFFVCDKPLLGISRINSKTSKRKYRYYPIVTLADIGVASVVVLHIQKFSFRTTISTKQEGTTRIHRPSIVTAHTSLHHEDIVNAKHQ